MNDTLTPADTPDTINKKQFSRMISWSGKAFWTIADQGLFAGSNFVLSILLARWLTESDFGAYGIGLTVFWMAGTLHTGLLAEPMLVFGAGRFRENLAAYTAFAFKAHAALTLPIGLLLAAAGLMFQLLGNSMLPQVFYALSMAQFFILLMWMLRKACYVRLRPRVSAAGGGIYAAIMLPCAYMLFSHNILNSWSAIGLISAASAASSITIIFLLRINPFANINSSVMSQAFAGHLSYGKWAAVTGIITWIPEQLPFIMTGVWHGLNQTAATRALWNFAMPVAHICTALSVFLVPVFVKIRTRPKFLHTVAMLTAALTIPAVLYWFLIGFYGQELILLFYKGRYINNSSGLWIIGAITSVSGALSVLSAYIRAIEKPKYVFWSYALASAVCLGPGMFLMKKSGVTGALLCIAVSLGFAAVFMAAVIVRQSRKQKNIRKAKFFFVPKDEIVKS